MVDIETWGTRPGSVIVSLAAVRFDTQGHLHDTFSVVIDAADAMRHGLTVDAPTLYWWLKQPGPARMALVEGGQPLLPSLQRFSNWMRHLGDDVEVWAKGADFELPLLAAAYAAFDLPVPWKYWNIRCLRTLLALAPPCLIAVPAAPHNALADATAQAMSALAALGHLSSLVHPSSLIPQPSLS